MDNCFDPLTGGNAVPNQYHYQSTAAQQGPDLLAFYVHYLYNSFFSNPDNVHAYGDLMYFLDCLPPNLKPALGGYLVKATRHYINNYNWHLKKLGIDEYKGPPSTSTFGQNLKNLHPHGDECECDSPECAEHKKSRMPKQEQQNIDEESSIVEVIEEKVLEPKHPYTEPKEPFSDPKVFSSIKENFTEEIKTLAEKNFKQGGNLIDLSFNKPDPKDLNPSLSDAMVNRALFIQQKTNLNLMDQSLDKSNWNDSDDSSKSVLELQSSKIQEHVAKLHELAGIEVTASSSTEPTKQPAKEESIMPMSAAPEGESTPTLIDVSEMLAKPSASMPTVALKTEPLIPTPASSERKSSPTMIDVPVVSIKSSLSTPTLVPERKASLTLIDVSVVSVQPSASTPTVALKTEPLIPTPAFSECKPTALIDVPAVSTKSSLSTPAAALERQASPTLIDVPMMSAKPSAPTPTLIDVSEMLAKPSASTPTVALKTEPLIPSPATLERKPTDVSAVSTKSSSPSSTLVPERKSSPTLIDVPVVSVQPSASTPTVALKTEPLIPTPSAPERKSSPTMIDVPVVSVKPSSPSSTLVSKKDNIFASSEFVNFFGDLKLGSNSTSATSILGSFATFGSTSTKVNDKQTSAPKAEVNEQNLESKQQPTKLEVPKVEANGSKPEPKFKNPQMPAVPNKTNGAVNGSKETIEELRERAEWITFEEEREKIFKQLDTFNWGGTVIKKPMTKLETVKPNPKSKEHQTDHQKAKAATCTTGPNGNGANTADNPQPQEQEEPKEESVAELDQATLDPLKSCIFCPSLKHRTAECSLYKMKEDRIYRLMELKRCSLCLSLKHGKYQCPQKDLIKCAQCYLPHLEMLYHDKV